MNATPGLVKDLFVSELVALVRNEQVGVINREEAHHLTDTIFAWNLREPFFDPSGRLLVGISGY